MKSGLSSDWAKGRDAAIRCNRIGPQSSWLRKQTVRDGPKSALIERLNQELKRRTHVIRIFPNEESALRLIRALAVEIHEDWIEAHRYLNMEMLREQRKQLQLLEAA